MGIVNKFKGKIFSRNIVSEGTKQSIILKLQKGDFDDALSEIVDLASSENLSEFDQIRLNSLKSIVHSAKGEIEISLDIANSILEKSKKLDSPILISESILAVSKSLFEKGEINRIHENIDEGIDFVEKIGRKYKDSKNNILADLYSIRGKVYRKQGSMTEAIDWLERCISLRDSSENRYEKADPLNTIGIIHASRGDFDHALKYLDESRKLFDQIGNKLPILKIYNNMGMIHSQKGNLDLGLENYNKGLELAEELENLPIIGSVSMNIGLIHVNKGELDIGLGYFERAKSIFEDIKHPLYLSVTLTNIATVYEQKGKLDEAMIIYNASLAISEELGNKQEIASIKHNLGNIHLRKGEYEKSLDNYETSLTLFEESENKLSVCETIFNMISLYIETTSEDAADTLLDKLKSMNEEDDNEFIGQMYLLSKAIILKSRERIVDKVEGLSLLKEIVSTDLIKNEYMIQAMLNLSELLLLELRISGNEEVMDEIRDLLDKLIILGEKTNQIPLLVEVRILQSKIEVLDLNIVEAQELLSVACEIAESAQLIQLVNKITNEQNELEDEMRKVSDMIESNATLYERIQKSKLEDYINKVAKYSKDGEL
ncbi:MAG: tetratricopeptide repeat protein [Candidatus Heimdallarchaeota archaeon]|nr:tetratricopeptide repeat protein [Candidatus Heimdallarchaeota archaeon]